MFERTLFALALCAPLTACAVDDGSPESTAEGTAEALVPVWSADYQMLGGSWTSPTIGVNGYYVIMEHPGQGVPNQVDTSMWFSSWDYTNAQGWPFEQQVRLSTTADAESAMAAFGTQIYLVHNGGDPNGGDPSLWMQHYDPPTHTWSNDYRMPYQSDTVPAIAGFAGRLYMVRHLYGWTYLDWSTNPSDPGSWHEWGTVPITLDGGSMLSLAVYQGQLYLAFGDNGVPPNGVLQDQLAVIAFNGTNWTGYQSPPVPGGPLYYTWCASSRPHIAAFRGLLYLVHDGCAATADPTSMWVTTYDGTSWTPDQQIWGHWASHGFSIGATPSALYVMHDSNDGSERLWYAFLQ